MPTGEVSTHAIAVHAIDQGKKVFVPYIHKLQSLSNGKTVAEMEMLALHSKEDLESLKRDGWGIPTLEEDSVPARENALGGLGVAQGGPIAMDDPSQRLALDLILMPGMAFDSHNRRLGHGRGFYDRYLQRYQSASKSRTAGSMPLLVGLALKEQVLSEPDVVPTGADDWRVDQVITAD